MDASHIEDFEASDLDHASQTALERLSAFSTQQIAVPLRLRS
jgi:hypothetical protein